MKRGHSTLARASKRNTKQTELALVIFNIEEPG